MKKDFNEIANEALEAMEKKAREFGIKGVAVVIRIEDETSNVWDCKIRVVDTFKRGPRNPDNPKDTGGNFAAIAFSKAAEMADTLQSSGSGVRAPLKGELGARGGLINKYTSGYMLASFSGGPSDQDVEISREGMNVLTREI